VTELPLPEAKAAVVEEMFDRIAPRYERMNHLLTLGMDNRWRRTTLEMAHVESGQWVLDLACGTGDFARLVATLGAEAAGVDFSAQMLRHAQARERGNYVRGDALALPFADGRFDAVVSGFAVRNFTALETVFQECARVTKAGGKLAILEIDSPRSLPLRAGHSVYFGHLMPLLGGLVSGDRSAYKYLSRSGAYLPTTAEFAALFHGAGYRDVRKRSLMGGAIQIVVGERA
jgi:demethylmenaquinone methyltransferase/2-methoxy-6-polyprenyl-1,4-benzoquinol methylase